MYKTQETLNVLSCPAAQAALSLDCHCDCGTCLQEQSAAEGEHNHNWFISVTVDFCELCHVLLCFIVTWAGATVVNHRHLCRWQTEPAKAPCLTSDSPALDACQQWKLARWTRVAAPVRGSASWHQQIHQDLRRVRRCLSHGLTSMKILSNLPSWEQTLTRRGEMMWLVLQNKLESLAAVRRSFGIKGKKKLSRCSTVASALFCTFPVIRRCFQEI